MWIWDTRSRFWIDRGLSRMCRQGECERRIKKNRKGHYIFFHDFFSGSRRGFFCLGLGVAGLFAAGNLAIGFCVVAGASAAS